MGIQARERRNYFRHIPVTERTVFLSTQAGMVYTDREPRPACALPRWMKRQRKRANR